MNQQPLLRKPMSPVIRMLIPVMGILFIVGMLGGVWVIWKGLQTRLPEPDKELDAYLESTFPHLGQETQNLSIAVTRFQNQIYDRYWPEPQNDSPRSLFLGRVFEPFIAQALMILSDRDQVNLDGEIGDWLDELPAQDRSLSIASWLTHHGIGADPAMGESEGVEISVTRSLERDYLLLEQVIAVVTGLPCHEFIQKEILDPLDMKVTHFNNGTQPAVADPTAVTVAPTTGWYTSLADMVTWEAAINSNRLISFKTHLRGFTPARLGKGAHGLYGFGWRIEPYSSLSMQLVIGHEPGGAYCLLRVPQKNFAALIFADPEPATIDWVGLSRDIVRIYLGREVRAIRLHAEDSP